MGNNCLSIDHNSSVNHRGPVSRWFSWWSCTKLSVLKNTSQNLVNVVPMWSAVYIN